MNEGILDIGDFREMTGFELESDDEIAAFNRANARATRYLERILGWSFTYRAQYEEAGKAINQTQCPTEEQFSQWQTNPEEYRYFDDPDVTVGSYKLLPYYPADANYMIDPATAVHTVKLAKVMSGSGNQFITIYEYKPDEWHQKPLMNTLQGKQPLVKWLEVCEIPNEFECDYMLAVDADWCKRLPEDLLYVLGDLTLFYMQHPFSLAADSTYAVSSESVDGHSVSYNTNVTNMNAKNSEEDVIDPYLGVLKYYIGPYSPLNQKLKVL